jgi:GR25 family glycosyltransferase involved in LPS biosynthesis
MMTKIADYDLDFVCINVESNLKRREHIEKMAAKAGIPMRFFKAITPQTRHLVPNFYQESRTRLWWKRGLIPTEQACCLSHLTLWREFIQSSHDYLVVFEDDVEISSDFMPIIEKLCVQDFLPDFLKLSGQHERPCRKVTPIGLKAYHLFLNAYGPIDAACYILSKAGAKSLLAYCQNMHMAIDVLMDRSYDHGVDCYTLKPYPVSPIHDVSGDLISQIGFEERKISFDHSSFWLKMGFRCLRAYSSVKKRWASFKVKYLPLPTNKFKRT